MDTTQIQDALERSRALPRGRGQTEYLETVAAAAKSGPDRLLEGQVLLELAEAYTYAGERDLAPVAYGRLLRIYDEFPAELGSLSHDIHWYLKWMTWGLIDNPAVGLSTVHRWLDELEHRYRRRGYSLRPVFGLRAELARKTGDRASATALLDASMTAPRDSMSDCDACERNEWGATSAHFGDHAAALAHWQPVLDGERVCAEEPHRVLAQALLPLLYTGRIAEARSAHLTGYPLVRHTPDLRFAVGLHIEFCALTGNEARGLEILAEHVAWLSDPGADAAGHLSFATGVCVLLRRLVAIGPVGVNVGTGTVESALAQLDSEIAELCARYDLRNGNTAVSTRVAQRLARRPLLDRLPLGTRAVLPQPMSAARVEPAAAGEWVERANRLSETASARLADAPHEAEQILRRALAAGPAALPAELLARLSSQLVTAIAGQPAREIDLADAALSAAARWAGLSEPDAVHHTLVAARAFHRADRHGEAAAVFEQALADSAPLYPRAEIAVIRGQFGDSLRELGRHRDAAQQFAAAARLIQDDPDRAQLHARLAWSAATALEYCGADDESVAAYLRAAELWGELGLVVPRSRCLRSAAWLQRWRDTGDGDQPWADTMRALLAELAALAETMPSAAVTDELARTRRELAEMSGAD